MLSHFPEINHTVAHLRKTVPSKLKGVEHKMNILLKGFTKFKFVSLCTLKVLKYFGANIVEKTKYNCFAFSLDYVRMLCINFTRQYFFAVFSENSSFPADAVLDGK